MTLRTWKKAGAILGGMALLTVAGTPAARAAGPDPTPVACPWGTYAEQSLSGASCAGGFDNAWTWTAPYLSIDAASGATPITVGSGIRVYIWYYSLTDVLNGVSASPRTVWVAGPGSWTLPAGDAGMASVVPAGTTATSGLVTVSEPFAADSIWPDQMTWRVSAQPPPAGDTLKPSANGGLEAVPEAPATPSRSPTPQPSPSPSPQPTPQPKSQPSRLQPTPEPSPTPTPSPQPKPVSTRPQPKKSPVPEPALRLHAPAQARTGHTIPVSVLLTENGKPFARQTVRLTTTAGRLRQTTVTTNAQGIAHDSIANAPSGTLHVTARHGALVAGAVVTVAAPFPWWLVLLLVLAGALLVGVILRRRRKTHERETAY